MSMIFKRLLKGCKTSTPEVQTVEVGFHLSIPPMKTLHLLAIVGLVGLVVLPGCSTSRRYTVTLNSGIQITALSKPQLRGNVYVFKNAKGEEGFVPAGRVREIAPASMATTDSSRFKATAR
jgi:hypothetical protein